MIWFDARDDVHRQAQGFVNALSKTIWLLLGALVPALVTAFVKAMQDRSRSQRAAQLTDRISVLSKSIAELPEITTGGTAPVTPRQALSAELNIVLGELYLLQTKVKHNFHWVSVSALTRFRSALLLFKPRGFKAFTLHAAFYVYTAVFLFCGIAVILPQDNSSSPSATATSQPDSPATPSAAAPGASAPQDNSNQSNYNAHRPTAASQNQPFLNTASWGDFFSDLAAYVVMVGLASIPMLLFRYYAVKIHRQQTQADGAQIPAPAKPVVAASPATASD